MCYEGDIPTRKTRTGEKGVPRKPRAAREMPRLPRRAFSVLSRLTP